jgi:hypothetical protein
VSPCFYSRRCKEILLTVHDTTVSSDLDQLRDQHMSQISEAKNMSTQSQTVMNLNLKLQSTVSKARAKTVDLELGRLQATQAIQQLAIVQVRTFFNFFSFQVYF